MRIIEDKSSTNSEESVENKDKRYHTKFQAPESTCIVSALNKIADELNSILVEQRRTNQIIEDLTLNVPQVAKKPERIWKTINVNEEVEVEKTSL